MKVKNNNSTRQLGSSRACDQFDVWRSPWLQTEEETVAFIPVMTSKQTDAWCFILLLLILVTGSGKFCTSELSSDSFVCQCIKHHTTPHRRSPRRICSPKHMCQWCSRLILPNVTFSLHSVLCSEGNAASCGDSGCISLFMCQAPPPMQWSIVPIICGGTCLHPD